jgi:hypothetical protein
MFDGSVYPNNLTQMFEYLPVLRYGCEQLSTSCVSDGASPVDYKITVATQLFSKLLWTCTSVRLHALHGASCLSILS